MKEGIGCLHAVASAAACRGFMSVFLSAVQVGHPDYSVKGRASLHRQGRQLQGDHDCHPGQHGCGCCMRTAVTWPAASNESPRPTALSPRACFCFCKANGWLSPHFLQVALAAGIP